MIARLRSQLQRRAAALPAALPQAGSGQRCNLRVPVLRAQHLGSALALRCGGTAESGVQDDAGGGERQHRRLGAAHEQILRLKCDRCRDAGDAEQRGQCFTIIATAADCMTTQSLLSSA